jgi:hypothetical protein
MRMWMVNPRILCRKHLLGEHVEVHMLSAWLLRGKRIDGWVDGNCLEPRSIGARHRALAAELTRRGYKHRSPLRQPRVLKTQHPSAKINKKAALQELLRRCPACKALKMKLKIT